MEEKAMNNKVKLISIPILMLAILVGIAGCAGKNTECKVTLDRKGSLDILVNPPGETGKASQDGSLQKMTSISSSGGSISKITTYSGEIEKQYPESGNNYTIGVNITIEDEQLTAYQLTVAGGVYGETPHVCTFPGEMLGGNKIVGRWETFYNDERTAGMVYEFYSDGSGATFSFHSAFGLNYQANVSFFTYTYTASGLVHMTPSEVPEELMKTQTYEVTFVSDDEIVLKPKGLEKEWEFFRAPIPEMPIRARGRLGGLLLLEGRSLVSTERLEGDWQDRFPGYGEVWSDIDEEAIAANPEQWLAFIQMAGEAEPRLYILIEQKSYSWGVIQLEKQE
jgi:hypothetical protein